MRAAADDRCLPGDHAMRAMYQRTLALWVGDLLATPPQPRWASPDRLSDYESRDWRAFYDGAVVDD